MRIKQFTRWLTSLHYLIVNHTFLSIRIISLCCIIDLTNNSRGKTESGSLICICSLRWLFYLPFISFFQRHCTRIHCTHCTLFYCKMKKAASEFSNKVIFLLNTNILGSWGRKTTSNRISATELLDNYILGYIAVLNCFEFNVHFIKILRFIFYTASI